MEVEWESRLVRSLVGEKEDSKSGKQSCTDVCAVVLMGLINCVANRMFWSVRIWLSAAESRGAPWPGAMTSRACGKFAVAATDKGLIGRDKRARVPCEGGTQGG